MQTTDGQGNGNRDFDGNGRVFSAAGESVLRSEWQSQGPHTQAGTGYPPAQGQAQASGHDTSLTFARNVRMERRLIEQAIIRRLGEVAPARNIAVPSDILDLVNRSTLHFVDRSGALVDVDAVVVVWSEG